MRKFSILLLFIFSIIFGCVTVKDETQGYGNFTPSFRILNQKEWFTLGDVRVVQDEESLYFIMDYTSDESGNYSFFNSPSGDIVMERGNFVKGKSTIIQSIKKNDLDKVDGITVFFSPGDYQNETGRTGFFVEKEEIELSEIPEKSDDMIIYNDVEQINPSITMLDEKAWLNIKEINIFQNDDNFFFEIDYTSKKTGKYSFSDPPDGSGFKMLGELKKGDGTIIQTIRKEVLNGNEGVTMLLFPGDYNHDDERTGFFINSYQLQEESTSREISHLLHQNNQKTDLEFREVLISKLEKIDLETYMKDDIIQLFGQPDRENYFAGGSRRTFSYPDRFNVVFRTDTGNITELRIHNPGPVIEDSISVGSTMEEFFSIFSEPRQVINSASEREKREPGVLYRMGNSSYYMLPDLPYRFFFDESDRVSALYILSSHFE